MLFRSGPSRGTSINPPSSAGGIATVAEGVRMWVEPGGKKAGFFKNKQLFVKDIPSGKIDLKDPVNFSDMKITIDYAKEWAQIFDEAWRAFRTKRKKSKQGAPSAI